MVRSLRLAVGREVLRALVPTAENVKRGDVLYLAPS